MLGTGPIVVWYASNNGAKRLHALHKLRPKLDDQGAQVVVITSRSPADTSTLARDVGTDFTFLSDPDRTAARDFGVDTRDGAHASAFALDCSGVVRWHSRHPSASKVVGALTSESGLPMSRPSRVLGSAPVVIGAVAILAALAVLARLANHTLLSWDKPVRRVILRIDLAPFPTILHWLKYFGDRYVLAPVTIVLAIAIWDRCRQTSAALVAALPLGLIVELLIKLGIARPRPSGAVGLNSSFPSGHVVAGVGFWGLIPLVVLVFTARLWAWRVGVVAQFVIALGLGLSRVYSGAHWPSDVVSGYVVGALILFVMNRFLSSRILECDGCPLHPLRYGRRSRSAVGDTPVVRCSTGQTRRASHCWALTFNSSMSAGGASRSSSSRNASFNGRNGRSILPLRFASRA
jgi:undecaprenyl-diphosphatase